MDEALRRFKQKFHKRGEGDTMIYADDIALWSSDREDIINAVKIWDEVLTEMGMKMNVGKTEIMTVSRQQEGDIVIEIRGNRVRNVKEVKYLGSIFTSEGNNRQEITDRITQYTKSTGALYPLLKDEHIPNSAKKIIFESILTPTLMYGSETWSPNKRDRSRIQAAEMKPLRTILGKSGR